ncbi:MAG: hypothetical protein IKS49_02305 [Actinomycetaceae bacterium]|nr:hypothetical protein [Actinomycetaceae bacterium]
MIEKCKNYYEALRSQLQHGSDSERGDVPGWVLITLMTAGLVVTIWTVAGPALTQVFNTAIEKVTTF